MSDVRLSDPCPCGSGRKFKRCCKPRRRAPDPVGPKQGPGLLQPMEVDEAVAQALAMQFAIQVSAWIVEQDEPLVARVLDAFGTPPDDEVCRQGMEFLVHLVAYASSPEAAGRGGERWCERFVEEASESFDVEVSLWFDLELAGWFSLWQVVRPPSQGRVELRDLLTGHVRQVSGVRGFGEAKEGDVYLARVLGRPDRAMGWCTAHHPRVVSGQEAPRVLEVARRRLGLGDDRLAPERLQGPLAWVLAETWRDLAPGQFRLTGTAPGPHASTSLIMDPFTFAKSSRRRVLAALERAFGPGTEKEDGSTQFFVLGGEAAEDEADALDSASQVLVLGDCLDVVHPGASDADAATAAVVAALGSLAQRQPRETQSTFRILAGALLAGRLPPGVWGGMGLEEEDEDMDGLWDDDDADADGGEAADAETADPELDLSPEDVDAVVVMYKRRHYEGWLDEPLPILRGRTPRQVARGRDATLRAELEATLESIEATERRELPSRRFDVGMLRRELRMGG